MRTKEAVNANSPKPNDLLMVVQNTVHSVLHILYHPNCPEETIKANGNLTPTYEIFACDLPRSALVLKQWMLGDIISRQHWVLY